MHPVSPDDPAARYAIYKVYGGECFYLNRPLDKNFYKEQSLEKNIDFHLRLVAERSDENLVHFNQNDNKVRIIWDI
ncbi:hypothetical protein ASG89_06325 [Paenibacillus sp. Soil766]|uniref:hypothetical protein n=1 Tax=Paenibacillus sp. Soil766 TaxID=1736404 RepID=UPI00070B4ADE|nr:hypothetical protein [Paenibacillus sp. Soil766]KRE93117.1 hypothetical protein ASG89_06325 [Paenibacillus sp. Soil766]